MADPEPPPESLSSLRERVERARAKHADANMAKPQNAASLAMRFGGEFGAAILVGALLGFGADHFLHSAPWGLVIGLALGFIAGIVNVTRLARTFSAPPPNDADTD
jgi:ATP synthase protein I